MSVNQVHDSCVGLVEMSQTSVTQPQPETKSNVTIWWPRSDPSAVLHHVPDGSDCLAIRKTKNKK